MLTRRELVAACVTGTAAILAGCSGDDGGDGSGGDGGSTDGTSGDDGTTDDSSDGGTSDDGSTDGTSGDDGTTDDSSDGGTSDDGSETGDDQSGDDTADGDGSEDDGTAGRTFGELTSFPESYAMEATVESQQGTVEMSGRFNQGDLYWEYTVDGQQAEMYFVGEDTFFVFGNQCFEGTQRSPIDREQIDPSEYESGDSSLEGLEPTGTDTIDGDDVLVYETSGDAEVGQVTYYVLEDSGYPRRIETENGEWNFHSWNEADPIEPPDMDCQSQYGG